MSEARADSTRVVNDMEKIICQERTMNGADSTQLMEEGCVRSILIIGQGREVAADIVSYGATNKPLIDREL